jgi:cyclopropane-fatty-acyl-phospholipid synthase
MGWMHGLLMQTVISSLPSEEKTDPASFHVDHIGRQRTDPGVLSAILRRTIRHGSLSVIDWRGHRENYGDGAGPQVCLRIHDSGTAWKLFLDPESELGEAWMDGRVTLEEGDLRSLLSLLFRSLGTKTADHASARIHAMLRNLSRRFLQINTPTRSKGNVARHYDLSGRLYDLFLDEDRQYSCGYFRTGDETLEECQRLKKRHLAAKLLLHPGQKVLDIGSGWGGLGLTLAAEHGVEVTGVTLSEEQLDFSNRRARNEGLAEKVRFLFRDYRMETGLYDRIVSVGMFEHVGVNHYGTFFRKVSSLLRKGGVALLHTIGRNDGPGHTNPWIARHIFPGGYAPALSEILPAIERSGLLVNDIEILNGSHYARTLRLWEERFQRARPEIRRLYDERFCRMWEFYLTASEQSFLHRGLTVFQIQMSNDLGAVPATRDYIAAVEV